MASEHLNAKTIASAAKGDAFLVLIAHTPVALSPKVRLGDTLTEALVRAANVMCVRQFKNNIEARVKAKGAMTPSQISDAWANYQPDVSVDSVLDEAALRVGASLMKVDVKAIKSDNRKAVVAKVLSVSKHVPALLSMIDTLVEESKVEKPKVDSVTLNLDAI